MESSSSRRGRRCSDSLVAAEGDGQVETLRKENADLKAELEKMRMKMKQLEDEFAEKVTLVKCGQLLNTCLQCQTHFLRSSKGIGRRG